MPLVALCLLLAAALPAWAQQTPNDLEVLKKYAGTWAVDCRAPAGPRLVVDLQSLTLQADGRQLRTTAPLSAFSYFGKQPPPAGFDVALLGEGQPTGLSLLAMKDRTGPYLTVDADKPLRQQFGDKALAGKFRPCP
jgi:invasion protein IalB